MKEFEWTERYKLLADDDKFTKEFDDYIRNLISDIKNSEKKVIEVDKKIYNFIENYVKKKRKNRINSILGKKDI